MSSTLPQFLRDLLSSCPKSGSGVHAWLFRCARQLHAHYSSSEEIARLLEAASHGCGRAIPRREIEAAIADAAKCAWTPSGQGTTYQTAAKWPTVNQEQREAIIRDGLKLVDLWESSPVRLESSDGQTEAIIDALFPDDALLCCGQSSSRFATRTRAKWHGKLAGLPLIVPSPMSKRFGLTKDGKQSEHCLDNTGPRRFLVVEFDPEKWEALTEAEQQKFGSKDAYYAVCLDEHAALLGHLAGFGPLTLAVHSGSKSLHGWFAVNGQPEDKLNVFMRYAASLGADPATWTRSQFVRMPDGTRDNGNRQAVYFFKPEAIKQ